MEQKRPEKKVGRPPMAGEAKVIHLNLRLSQAEADQITAAAEALHTTRTGAVVEAVRRMMESNNKK